MREDGRAMGAGARRGVVIASSVFLAVTIAAYVGLALTIDAFLDDASARCLMCVQSARSAGGDASRCDARPNFTLARLVPWKSERREELVGMCREATLGATIDYVTLLAPSRARRDALLARSASPDADTLYRAGAFERWLGTTPPRDGSTPLGAAMQTRSFDSLRLAARRTGADLPGRNGAWLCLLGEEEEGRRLLQRWIRLGEHGAPDQYPLAWMAPLGLYACGGDMESADAFEMTGLLDVAIRQLRMARGELTPAEMLSLPGPWTPDARRFALAPAIVAADTLPLARTLDWLRYASDDAPRRCASGTLLDGPTLPIDPEAALAAADRLLAWAAEQSAAFAELEATLPDRVRSVETEGSEATVETLRPDLGAHVRGVAAGLRFDAAWALISRAESGPALDAFAAARELKPVECGLASLVAGEPLTGEPPDDAEARAEWLEAAGRDAEALDALDAMGPHDHPVGWRGVALAMRLQRPAPEVESDHHPSLYSPELWRREIDAGNALQIRRELVRSPWLSSRAGELGMLGYAARFEVSARVVEGHDVDFFHSMVFTSDVTRSALWARARAAARRGDDETASTWDRWYREIAGLASTPPRALLLAMALGDQWTGAARPYDVRSNRTLVSLPPDAPWDGPVWRRSSPDYDAVYECPPGVSSLVDDHLPAADDAELAYRFLDRDHLAERARSQIYVVERRPTLAQIDEQRAVVRISLESGFSCDSGRSVRSEAFPGPTEAELDALEIEDAAFWLSHDDRASSTIRLGIRPARVQRVSGVGFWQSELFELELPVGELTRELLGHSYRGPVVQLAVRVRGVRDDPAAGTWVDGEVVAVRVANRDQVFYEGPPTRPD